MIQAATPYFILNGKTEEAIEFYRQSLSAIVESKRRFGEVDQSCPTAIRDHIMHAELRVGKALIMLSDGSPNGKGPTGSAVSVALDVDDAAELRRCFDALAVSGTVVQPVFDAPWGALFGVVSDRFGISWMLNSTKPTS